VCCTTPHVHVGIQDPENGALDLLRNHDLRGFANQTTITTKNAIQSSIVDSAAMRNFEESLARLPREARGQNRTEGTTMSQLGSTDDRGHLLDTLALAKKLTFEELHFSAHITIETTPAKDAGGLAKNDGAENTLRMARWSR
jgi:hypothetical protein